MGQIDKSVLIGFLKEVDRRLNRKISLVAVGGTAMTLLGLKSSTMDIDFCLAGEDELETFRRALDAMPHGFKVDLFVGGLIFSQQLPADYAEKSVKVRGGLRNIRLSALHPLDIVVTKIGRLAARDEEDIADCISKWKLGSGDIERRAQSVHYIGNEGNYEANLKAAMKMFFPAA